MRRWNAPIPMSDMLAYGMAGHDIVRSQPQLVVHAFVTLHALAPGAQHCACEQVQGGHPRAACQGRESASLVYELLSCLSTVALVRVALLSLHLLGVTSTMHLMTSMLVHLQRDGTPPFVETLPLIQCSTSRLDTQVLHRSQCLTRICKIMRWSPLRASFSWVARVCADVGTEPSELHKMMQ